VIELKELYELDRRDEGCFIKYFKRDWYKCENVMIIKIWLDEKYIKEKKGKIFMVKLILKLVKYEKRR
jgi:hypothetical protein